MRRISPRRVVACFLTIVFASTWGAARVAGQQPEAQPPPPALEVNWLYGAYVPKDVPLVPLSPAQRGQLWVRQTFLTPGIYAKTAFFALGDQINETPSGWDADLGGFGQRFSSRYGQFAIQNSITAAGNWALGYEPRYERCRCSGAWPRVRHALVRNFVTYNATERERRPQIGMYAGAFGAGLVASTWRPAEDDLWEEGVNSLITQAMFGSLANLVGEFAEEIRKLFGRDAASGGRHERQDGRSPR
jgi:hypothetical protein